MKKLLATLLFLAATTSLANAQEAVPTPLTSITRLSIAAGAQRAWDQSEQSWEAGVFGSFKLTNHVNLVAADVWNFDKDANKAYVGLRVVLFRGGK